MLGTRKPPGAEGRSSVWWLTAPHRTPPGGANVTPTHKLSASFTTKKDLLLAPSHRGAYELIWESFGDRLAVSCNVDLSRHFSDPPINPWEHSTSKLRRDWLNRSCSSPTVCQVLRSWSSLSPRWELAAHLNDLPKALSPAGTLMKSVSEIHVLSTNQFS